MLMNMKDDAQHELEPDTWQPLLTANTLILETLHVKAISEAVAHAAPSSTLPAKQNDERGPHAKASDDDKQRAKDQRRYVDHRLREFAAFERRAGGGPIKRRI